MEQSSKFFLTKNLKAIFYGIFEEFCKFFAKCAGETGKLSKGRNGNLTLE
jgi:hypothetical protein